MTITRETYETTEERKLDNRKNRNGIMRNTLIELFNNNKDTAFTCKDISKQIGKDTSLIYGELSRLVNNGILDKKGSYYILKTEVNE